MNTKKSRARILLGASALTIVFSFPNSAFAVEGALGRPISGAAIAPYAGVIPPEPGLAVATGEAYYPGSIGGSVPIGNFNLNLGIEIVASFTPLAVFYIWPTECKQWNFASTMSLPLAYVEVEATVTLGPLNRKETDRNFGLFDIVVTPIIASYHISQTDHVAFSFTFWAPTGDYDPNRLASLGLNNWTFIPGLAYTKIFPKSDIELTSIWQLQFYTENPATHYQNGILSDFELMGIKRFKNGFGIGLIFGWIEEITDDTGPGADRLHGFRGRAFGLGPIITYSTRVGKSHLDFSARFIPEFGNENRVEGNNFQFSASLKF
jgi:hypothetical protein